MEVSPQTPASSPAPQTSCHHRAEQASCFPSLDSPLVHRLPKASLAAGALSPTPKLGITQTHRLAKVR